MITGSTDTILTLRDLANLLTYLLPQRERLVKLFDYQTYRNHRIDQLRVQTNVSEIEEDWKYVLILWQILDRI